MGESLNDDVPGTGSPLRKIRHDWFTVGMMTVLSVFSGQSVNLGIRGSAYQFVYECARVVVFDKRHVSRSYPDNSHCKIDVQI